MRGGRETVDGEISGGLLADEEEGGQAGLERALRQSRFPGKQGRRFRQGWSRGVAGDRKVDSQELL